MKQHLPISILVLAFVALAALYSAVVPLGEGPDEPGHAAYVFFVAREGRLPVQRGAPEQRDVPGEGHQPPLAYALAAPLVAWLPLDQRRIDLPGNPRFTWAGGAQLNAVAHGSRELWPWSGAALAWHLARLVSVACGAATVVLTYLTARELADQRPKTKDQTSSPLVLGPSSLAPLLAAALVAFNPQFLFVSALVTNDALLVALSAALLWLAVRRPAIGSIGLGTRGVGFGEPSSAQAPSPQPPAPLWKVKGQPLIHAIAIGSVLGLALITKQSAIILAPVAALSVLERSIATERSRSGGARWLALSPRHLVTLSVCAGVALLVCGWWYARNLRLYGDLFGLAAFQAEFATQPFDAASPAAWASALGQLHDSFWARFGWMNVRPPAWTIWCFGGVEAAAIAGWLWRLTDDQTTIGAEGAGGAQKRSFGLSSFVLGLGLWWPLLALPLLALGWIVSFALTAGLVAWQGRLLFPALPAIAILLAWGLTALGSRRLAVGSPQHRLLATGYWLLATGYCLVALWLPFGVIRPAYPFHTLAEQDALARLGTQVYGGFGMAGDPRVELRGWRMEQAPRAGATLDLALTWRAIARLDRDWVVFVHLVDAGGTIVAEDNRQPQAGVFPTAQWAAGDWVESHHLIALPATLAPGAYTLQVRGKTGGGEVIVEVYEID